MECFLIKLHDATGLTNRSNCKRMWAPVLHLVTIGLPTPASLVQKLTDTEILNLEKVWAHKIGWPLFTSTIGVHVYRSRWGRSIGVHISLPLLKGWKKPSFRVVRCMLKARYITDKRIIVACTLWLTITQLARIIWSNVGIEFLATSLVNDHCQCVYLSDSKVVAGRTRTETFSHFLSCLSGFWYLKLWKSAFYWLGKYIVMSIRLQVPLHTAWNISTLWRWTIYISNCLRITTITVCYPVWRTSPISPVCAKRLTAWAQSSAQSMSFLSVQKDAKWEEFSRRLLHHVFKMWRSVYSTRELEFTRVPTQRCIFLRLAPDL